MYGLYECADRTYALYFFGILFFFIGYSCINYNSKLNNRYINYDKGQNIKTVILILLSILSLYIFSAKSLKAVPYWLTYNIGGLKSAIVDDNALSIGPLGDIIYTFISRPLQKVMIIYAILIIFQRKKVKFSNIIICMAVLLTLLCYTCTGSKIAISEIIIMSIGYIYIFSKIKFSQIIIRYKKLSLCGLCAIGIIGFTISFDNNSIFEVLYRYLCGCLPCSDHAMNIIYDNQNFYGLVSFNGFFRILNIVPSYIGLTPEFQNALDAAFIYMQQFEKTIYIATNTPYNAFISMFTYFYADGGYMGVIILSFIIGMTCAYSLKKALSKPSYRSVALVLLIFLFIITSMIRIQTFVVYYAMCVMFILYLLPHTSLNYIHEK